MRDARRIEVVLELINKIWSKQPDTRFFQLIDNLQWEYSNTNGGRGRITVYEKEELKAVTAYRELPMLDLFYLEDDEFIEFLKEKVGEN